MNDLKQQFQHKVSRFDAYQSENPFAQIPTKADLEYASPSKGNHIKREKLR